MVECELHVNDWIDDVWYVYEVFLGLFWAIVEYGMVC